jgi:predicted dehydrogenase
VIPSRRSFLATAASAASAARAFGANESIRVGVIGTGGRGQYLLKELLNVGRAEVVAVCDIYDVRRAQAAKIPPNAAEQYLDYHQILERKDVDAVIVATPDHWHAQITVDALNAGKDVYVEKPMVHKPEDGQAIVKAVRTNSRVLQVGTQGRGLSQFRILKDRYFESGILGKVGMVRTWYTSNSGYVLTPPQGMEKKPEGLDWDRWLGPGPKVEWNPGIYFSPYKWLHYDGGMIMGIGIHVIDSAHHILSLKKPVSAFCGGGIHYYNDGRDTPDTVAMVLEYPEKLTMTFVAECLSAPGVRTSAGVELRGVGGVASANRYVLDPAWNYTPNSRFTEEPLAQGGGSPASAAGVLRNWIDSIKSRRKPVANEETAYYSTMACFMGLRSFATGQKVVWDPAWDI